MTTEQNLEQEIEALDWEAREAMDKLADRRAELERQHQATALAADRQREREEERRLEEEREAEEREHQKAVEEAGRLDKERLRLEVLAEEQAQALSATLKELLALDPGHRRAVVAAEGKAPEQRYSMSFSRMLGAWFRERFKEVVEGIGSNYHTESFSLPERDALTSSASPGGEEAEGAGERPEG